MLVQGLLLVEKRRVETVGHPIQLVAERLELTFHPRESRVDRVEPRVDRVEPRIDRLEPRVHGVEPGIRALLRAPEPAVHPFAECGNRHSNAANHSIVVCAMRMPAPGSADSFGFAATGDRSGRGGSQILPSPSNASEANFSMARALASSLSTATRPTRWSCCRSS